VLLGVFTAVTWTNVENLIAAGRLADHTRDQIGELETIVSLVKDAETGQRGYLLTGRKEYLEPYSAAVPRISEAFDRVDALSPEPESRASLRRLRELVDAKMTELRRTVELHDRGSHAEALALVDSNRGQRIMEQIRSDASALEAVARRRLGERTLRTGDAARSTRVELVAGAIMTYGLLALVAVLVLREIRDRTAFARERHRLYEEAQRALSVRDAFVSVAGHEFRTPIAALSLTLHNLRRLASISGQPAITEKLAGPLRSVKRLARLTDELLAVGRLGAGRMESELETFDLAALVVEVSDRLRDEAADVRSELKVNVAGAGVVEGAWDRSQLDQVITNLLTNAMKFGRGAPVEITLEASDGAARLTVRDHGIGIAPENQIRIFEKFERGASDRTYPGIGLGLWIARELVHQHGGTIRVESEPGRGAAFHVELPVRAEIRTTMEGSR